MFCPVHQILFIFDGIRVKKVQEIKFYRNTMVDSKFLLRLVVW